MLKIAHIRKQNSDEVRQLAEILVAKDLKRQDKKVEQLRKKYSELSNKKAGSVTSR